MALSSGISFTAASAGNGNFVFGSARSSFLTPAQAVALGGMADGFHYSYLAQDSLTNPTQREWGRARFTAATNTFNRTPFGGIDNGTPHSAGSAINFTSPPIVSLTVLADDLLGGPVGINTPIVFNAYSPQYYVNGTTGSDDNPGTAALPWKTLQHAADQLAQSNTVVDTTVGIITTVNIANGTYKGFGMTNTGLLGYGAEVVWQGNAADPTQVVIQEALAPDSTWITPIFLSFGGNLVFDSITIKPTPAITADNPFVQFNNFVAATFNNCRFDATAVNMGGIWDLGFANFCIISGNTFIDGNCDTLNHQGNYAIFEIGGNITFGASATFSNLLVGANYDLIKWNVSSVTGSPTGRQFLLQNCTVQTFGVAPSALPGTITGIMSPATVWEDLNQTPPVDYNPHVVTTTVASLGSTTVVPNILGMRAAVTDGVAGLGFGSTVSGSSSTKYLVWYNNANWTVIGK